MRQCWGNRRAVPWKKGPRERGAPRSRPIHGSGYEGLVVMRGWWLWRLVATRPMVAMRPTVDRRGPPGREPWEAHLSRYECCGRGGGNVSPTTKHLGTVGDPSRRNVARAPGTTPLHDPPTPWPCADSALACSGLSRLRVPLAPRGLAPRGLAPRCPTPGCPGSALPWLCASLFRLALAPGALTPTYLTPACPGPAMTTYPLTSSP